MYHFIRAFVERGVHVIFWSDNLHQDPIYTRPLQELGVEVIYGSRYVGQFQRWFSDNAAWIPYVLLSRPHIAIKFVYAIKNSSAATILYYGHDLHFKRLQDEYELGRSEQVLRLSREFKELEMQLWMMSDVIMYPSESERAIVQDLAGARKNVVAVPAWTFDPEVVEVTRTNGLLGRSPYELLFVGGFGHGPNVDGILWFTSEVLPLIRAHDARFVLTVVGSNAPDSILALSGADIRVLGFLDDDTLARLYRETGVAIVPLRFGGGVKGKVVEAFSKGVPVVTTPVGVQGITDAQDLAFIAETPADFAAAVIRAAEDRELARAKTDAAAAFVGREYTAAKLMRQLAPFMPELRQEEVHAG
jgi:glycosyltransferase involved in cell wall biosynthesis